MFSESFYQFHCFHISRLSSRILNIISGDSLINYIILFVLSLLPFYQWYGSLTTWAKFQSWISSKWIFLEKSFEHLIQSNFDTWNLDNWKTLISWMLHSFPSALLQKLLQFEIWTIYHSNYLPSTYNRCITSPLQLEFREARSLQIEIYLYNLKCYHRCLYNSKYRVPISVRQLIVFCPTPHTPV